MENVTFAFVLAVALAVAIFIAQSLLIDAKERRKFDFATAFHDAAGIVFVKAQEVESAEAFDFLYRVHNRLSEAFQRELAK